MNQMRYTGKLVQQALSSMLEILKQEVGEGSFTVVYNRYTGKLVQQALSSMLEILKQEVGEGRFYQGVHWVHQ